MNVLNQSIGVNYALYHGDCVEVLSGIPGNSIDYTITSPPFSSLYTYSASNRDMGNSKNDNEFFEHFSYLIKELYRVTVPGRLISLHCMNLPSTIQHQGYIGIRDFRGDLIRAFINDEVADFKRTIDLLKARLYKAIAAKDNTRVDKLMSQINDLEGEITDCPGDTGFYYHSEVCIWKDPVTAMQRTKAIGLLHKQVCKDSSISRQGLPDYLITFRKPGKNEKPISGEFEYYSGEKPPSKTGDKTGDSINIWQQYASPVWMDINQSNTLQFKSARDNNDERHVCPLQLQVIERGIQLWSNPGDTVLDPFNGIGSSGYVALKTKRKYVGIELKESYFNAAKNNLDNAEHEFSQLTLLDLMGFVS